MLMDEDDEGHDEENIRYYHHHLHSAVEEKKDSCDDDDDDDDDDDSEIEFPLSYCDPIEKALMSGTGSEFGGHPGLRGSPASGGAGDPPHMLSFATCGYCMPDCRGNNDANFRKTPKRVRFAMDYIHPNSRESQRVEMSPLPPKTTAIVKIPVPLPKRSDGNLKHEDVAGCHALGSITSAPPALLLGDKYPLLCLGSEADLAVDRNSDTLFPVVVVTASPKAKDAILHEKCSNRSTKKGIAGLWPLSRGPSKQPVPGESCTSLSSELSREEGHALESSRKCFTGKSEVLQWIQRNNIGLLLVLIGLALIVGLSVPIAVSTNRRVPLPGDETLNATNYNENTVNGTWSVETDTDPDSGANASIQKQCFSTTEELQRAVDTYLSFAFNSSSQEYASLHRWQMKIVAGTYGWPMNNWCTSNLTSLAYVFSARRNPLSARFNVDVGRWDVRRVQDFSRTFEGCKRFTHDLSKWQVGEGLEAGEYERRMQQHESNQVLRLDAMFLNASLYNNSLCTWGQRLWLLARPADAGEGNNDMPSRWVAPTTVTISAERMFRGTDCPYPQDPSFDSGPPSSLCRACGDNGRKRRRLRS
jgi:hypothetical protein